MKIGYFADGYWSHLAFEKILASPGLQIAFIVARYNLPDPVLKEIAHKIGVPFLVHPNVNSAEFIDSISCYKAELNVSMSFDQILRSDLINLAPLGFINCHAGALPFYRGRNVLNWALINGEKRFGVTVHYIDENIDTGDIILQRFGEISIEDNYASLLEKAANLCADTLYDALLQIKAGQVQRIRQCSIAPVGFYCGRRGPGDEWLDWNWMSIRIHNFVRGITIPGPCARTVINGREMAVIRTELVKDAPDYIGFIGEVVGRDQEGLMVKTGDSTIKIVMASYVDDGETGTGNVPSIPIGTRFESYSDVRISQLEKRLQKIEQLVQSLAEKHE